MHIKTNFTLKMKNSGSDILRYLSLFLVFAILMSPGLDAQRNKNRDNDSPANDSLGSSTFSGLKWRSIGPAFTSGRIADFAVNESNPKEYYVAAASGNVWKTSNAGNTYEPVFDNYGAYSIGVVTMDPTNHNVVWIGTGENNHQRALGYGDGVYKSTDGGKSFRNMGLKESRQIGGIVVDPRDPDIVFVAAEGSVWGPGGDRGLYKTSDGGETWTKVLEISENTGVNNVIKDPCRPDIMYATSEQRRRHVFTKIGGGPETAIYKSTDNGDTWRKIMTGIPGVDKGGMGIAVSPGNPDYVYVIIEARDGKGGFFRSTDRGESWSKMSDHSSSGQYYNEIFCDPNDENVVYSVETRTHVTHDGGKTWTRLSNDARHVDDHAMWIDPDDSGHFLIGGDGGVYETWDGGMNYHFKTNLPVTQFYRVMVDDEYPFYNVYGGTQDNNTLAGPSQNTDNNGVSSEEWDDILGGDGFWVATDPENPDLVYCEWQYGNLIRYDRKSGEGIYIKPRERKGELAYKWNWDAPLIISPHSNTRLYMGANKIFRSDDRGDSWKVISEDISGGIDRNTWPVMGYFWSYDAVAKDVSTSQFGMAVTLVESPVMEDLLYVGTDDGVISITQDAGETWSQVKSFPGIPSNTFVSDIMADKFDENVVYACFDNHKRDDFRPYVLKSTDKGRTWTSISGNLPERGSVKTLEQDHVNPRLLFAGTEFSAFFSPDGGKEWVQLASGLPTIDVEDMVIQARENDLVIATFGRGFYILDDFTPLRTFRKEMLEQDAHIFPVADARMFVQTGSKDSQGASFYLSKNPPYGATFTYYLKEVPKTLREERHEQEKELFDAKKPIPQPGIEDLRAEERETAPYLVFSIRDATGNEIRKISAAPSKGISRITWDLRYPSPWPVSTSIEEFNPGADLPTHMLAMPGTYSVSLSIVTRDGTTELAGPVEFRTEMLNTRTLPAEDYREVVDFQLNAAELVSVMDATERFAYDLYQKVILIKQTLNNNPGLPAELMTEAAEIGLALEEIRFKFEGREAVASWEEIPPAPMPLNYRLQWLLQTRLESTSGITGTEKAVFEILIEEFPPVIEELKSLHARVGELNEKLDAAGAPWTPGRIPEWQ